MYDMLREREWLERQCKTSTATEIAEMLGCHQTSVSGWLRHYGIKPKSHARPRWTEADDARLRELWDEHYLTREIAEKMGRTEGSVHQRAHNLKLERRKAQHLYFRNNGNRVKVSPRVSVLNPRGKNFDAYGCLMALSDLFDQRRKAA